MDALGNLLLGFSVALTPINLFWCLVGVVLGTVVGVLPGLGPAATIAMLLPLTLKMDHTTAIIALAGIFYGARYGGSTTWTAIRWRAKGERERRWEFRQFLPLSPEPWACWD
jgi:putative tricarboxylic transport membrane protein